MAWLALSPNYSLRILAFLHGFVLSSVALRQARQLFQTQQRRHVEQATLVPAHFFQKDSCENLRLTVNGSYGRGRLRGAISPCDDLDVLDAVIANSPPLFG